MANRFLVGGPNSKYAQRGAEPARFWVGLWHGVISPIVFVASLFTPDVRIYERNNRGVLYDLGFLLGAMLIFGGSKPKPRGKKGAIKQGAMLMSTEQNKAVVRRYFEEFHTQRALSIADEISEDSGELLSLASQLVTAFPDYQMKIVEQVAEGDNVTTVWTAKGTHLGEWLSPIGAIAATGKPVTWSGTTTLIVRNGRIAGLVGTNWDHLGILQQMGVVANTAPRPGA